jgi:hypothetical protein
MPMRTPIYLRAVLASAVAFGACAVFGPEALGVSAAEAKAYYTRKRVNGHWITGRFAKRHAAAAARHRAGKAAQIVTSTAALPAPSVSKALPETKSEVARPEAAVPTAPPPTATPPASDERLQGLREALQARAGRLVTTGSTGAVPAQSPARSSEPAAASDVGETKTAGPPREARSVSLDFETGIKTTLFSDGTTSRERFEIEALKGLAAPSTDSAAPSKPPQ